MTAVLSPITGEVIEDVAATTPRGLDAVLRAAEAAAPHWRAVPASERGRLLVEIGRRMRARAAEIAELETLNTGKLPADTRREADRAAACFEYYGGWADKAHGTVVPVPGPFHTYTTREPYGVVAGIIPWNVPYFFAAKKIAPALAFGNAVVLKPAAETPLTAIEVAGILAEAGVPDGVVNVVTTTDPAGVVTAWLTDERVRKVSFTGSTAVGRRLLHQAADRVLNASMELGGNAPFVVTADADLDDAVAGAMVAKFRNGGQACTAANRFYVHADVAEEFVARFGAAVEALTVGPASDPDSRIGPLISARAVDGVRALVEEAVAAGARVSHRAAAPGHGHFYPPTVLVDVAPDAPILAEEIFGPVAPVVTWTDEAELLRLVNGTELGLASYVYAGRLQDAIRLAEAFEAGMVGINRGIVSDPSTPFGGTKQSGLGREGAREGLREFQETRYFSVEL